MMMCAGQDYGALSMATQYLYLCTTKADLQRSDAEAQGRTHVALALMYTLLCIVKSDKTHLRSFREQM